MADRYDPDPSETTTLTPLSQRSQQEPREGGLVAVSDDPEGFAGVAVDDDSDVAIAPPQRRLIYKKDPAAAPPPLSCDPIRPVPSQRHDEMPRQAMTARHLPDRHGIHVLHQLAGQTPSHVGASTQDHLGVILPEPLPTFCTGEATADPHQRGGPAMRREIPDPEPARVVDP
jgi:hypothetical protein